MLVFFPKILIFREVDFSPLKLCYDHFYRFSYTSVKDWKKNCIFNGSIKIHISNVLLDLDDSKIEEIHIYKMQSNFLIFFLHLSHSYKLIEFFSNNQGKIKNRCLFFKSFPFLSLHLDCIQKLLIISIYLK